MKLPSIRGLPQAFWFLWAGTFVNRAGGFVVPFLAIYLTEQRGLSVAEAGFVVALFGAGTFSAGLVGGFLADRLGRKPTMVAGLVGGAAAMLLLGVVTDDRLIGGAAFLLGLVGDLYRPGVWAAVTDLVPEEDRTRAYGLLYWSINLGFAIAPVLAGVLAKYGFFLLFAGDAATSLVFGVLIALRVPETRPVGHAEHDREVSVAEALTPFRDVAFVGYALSTLVVATIFHQVSAPLAFDMRAHGISTETYGIVIALNGILIVVLQPFSLDYVGRLSPTRVLAAGAIATGIGFVIPAFATSVAAYAISVAVWTVGEIVSSPVSPVVVASLSPKRLRGIYQGTHQVIWGASSFFAPLLGSAVIAGAGAPALWLGCLGASALSAVGYASLGGSIARRAEVVRAAELEERPAV